MKIEVWSDYNCPFCYIGKTTLDKALRELGLSDAVQLEFKAFQLDPEAPKATRLKPVEALAKKYGVPQAQAQVMIDRVVDSARKIGLHYAYDKVQPTHTLDAHRLAKFAAAQQPPVSMHAALYQAYFIDGQNLADHATLAKLASAKGLDGDAVKAMLASEAYLAEVNADIAEAGQKGIRGVPYFLINRKFVINGAQPLANFVETLRNLQLEETRKLNRE